MNTCGIVHRVACPYTQEQNGSAEKKHREIVEHDLTLLAKASLPLRFWDEAFRTVVYLSNRLFTITLQYSTPTETLFHVKPDYTMIKVFGCACFPNLRPYNNHKLEFRSSPCIWDTV